MEFYSLSFCPRHCSHDLGVPSFVLYDRLPSFPCLLASSHPLWLLMCLQLSYTSILSGASLPSSWEDYSRVKLRNSLDFRPALKVFSYTLSSASSTSKVSQVKRCTYDLRISFSPCLMVSKWSAGFLGRCPPMKWRKKALLNCSKLSTDNVGNLVNHSLATPLRVVGKERHGISSGGC